MKLSEIARNLQNEGKKYKWGRHKLINGWQDSNPKAELLFCAVGIKAKEFGVPNVVLAYWDQEANMIYPFNLSRVTSLNDNAVSRTDLVERLFDEEEIDPVDVDFKSWINLSLKPLLADAISWATKNGYKSLLVDTEFKEVEIPS